MVGLCEVVALRVRFESFFLFTKSKMDVTMSSLIAREASYVCLYSLE